MPGRRSNLTRASSSLPDAFRLGLVGAGRMGATHARAIADSDRVELVAVVEPSDEAAAALPDVARLTLAQLAEGGEVDGVIVAVPTRYHVDVVAQLLRAGIPVLCEKPCGRTSAETRELARLATELDTGLWAAYWRRFVPELRALRDRIAAGQLGKISHVFCSQWDEHPPPASFRDPASSGGIVVDMGVHEFDLIRWLTGQEIERVCGFSSLTCFDPPVPGDPESVDLAARLSGGATALVTLGRRHPPGETVVVEAIGTENAARVEFVRPPDGDVRIAAALRSQAEAFAVAVRGGDWDGVTMADAVAASMIAEQAARCTG
jgi:myo-inositol 2-dehydrogenase / D-chiro-inositol 1-dehydrogenase